jgi:hypothetical protein
MALQSTGFRLKATLVDQGGNKATREFFLTAADYAAAQTAATAILAALASVTQALVRDYHLGEWFEEDTDVFGSGEIENIASLSARIDSSEIKYATVLIPAPADGLFQEATGPLYNVIDPSDAAVVAYLALWQTGQSATLSDGETLLNPATAGNVSGKRIHRKSRKG